MGDPEYIILCGDCVQMCLKQPVFAEAQKTKRISKTLKPIKRVSD